MEPTPYCGVEERPIETVPVPAYTAEEHGTWGLLLDKQDSLIEGRASPAFIEGVKRLNFPRDRIPRLVDVSRTIEGLTGWKLIRVEGLVHPKDFFELLSRRLFPSTDFIRKRSELMYTPAPDMFHDLFGHSPLLTNPDFTEFFQCFGQVGVNAYQKFEATNPIHDMVQRIYWFTVEFGLTESKDGIRAYGSGSVSSPEELQFCVGPKCRRHPFVIDKVAQQTFDIWHLQEDVFVIKTFAELGRDFRRWADAKGILH